MPFRSSNDQPTQLPRPTRQAAPEALDRPGNVEQSLPAGREEVNTMGVYLLLLT